MKKAVITVAGLQYVVSEGETISVNRLDVEKKSHTFVDAEARGEKVTAIRFKAKKRVTKVRGHKQSLTTLKIKSIA
jgi:ribosomal protein L21